MKTAVLDRPAKTRLPTPAFAIAAPARPPMRAWDEEDGSPHIQVKRFQIVAPTRAARISFGSTTFGATMPFPMVFATWGPNANAATKVQKAAQTTAIFGERTRVPTTVAMEVAASWKPLMKSNARARKMMTKMKVTARSKLG